MTYEHLVVAVIRIMKHHNHTRYVGTRIFAIVETDIVSIGCCTKCYNIGVPIYVEILLFCYVT